MHVYIIIHDGVPLMPQALFLCFHPFLLVRSSNSNSVISVALPKNSLGTYRGTWNWIGMWNVRSMNQGKLEVVKQEMARVNIDIWGISKIKWTGMGEFNSDNHYIYYRWQDSLRRNGVAIIINKSPKYSTWMQSQKWQNNLCSFPGQTIQ